jgi:hypothetical protein
MDARRRTLRLVVVAIAVTGAIGWAVASATAGRRFDAVATLGPLVAVVAAIVLYLQAEGRLQLPDRPSHPPFERAGPSFRAALVRAQAEAVRLDHHYIGTEHLLLGLLGDPGSTAGRLLAAESVDLAGIRGRHEAVVGRGNEPATGEIGLTPRSKQAISMAFDTGAQRGDQPVDDQHLLAGVLSVRDGLAAGLLVEAGVDIDGLRRKTEAAES